MPVSAGDESVDTIGSPLQPFGEQVGRLILPKHQERPVRSILIRVAVALGCVIVTTLLVYVERDGYRDASGDSLSLLDAAYYATVTLSTTGYGDITPISDSARITNIFVITPLRFVFLIVLVGTTIELLTQRTRYDWRVRKWRRKVSGHTVVIGYGIKGRSAVEALLKSGMPKDQIAVVAHDATSATEASESGITAVQGDARREQVLTQAGIGRAGQVIIATDQDATSVLVTMMARRLAPPEARIVSAARETANAEFLRESGADGVIVSADSVGRMLTLSLLSPTAGRLMQDLLESGRGIEVHEREVGPEELKLGPQDLQDNGELVLAVISKDGQVHRFNEPTVRSFYKGDRVVVIRESRNGGVGAGLADLDMG